MARIGVDVGGTFTDVVVASEGKLISLKVPSTPEDPSRGFAGGIGAALEESGKPPVELIAHGTTVATNAVLERKGARTALVATEGFRDFLQIGRQNRPRLYDLNADRPAPLIPREWSLEVPERISSSGEVLQALDEGVAREGLEELVGTGVESVAVCLLFSFIDPAHEKLLRQLLEELAPEMRVSLSSEVLPQFREYERASTTALDAYVGPVVERYLNRIQQDAGLHGAPVVVMRSGGGTMSGEVASKEPVHTLLSGPAAGVLGAAQVARMAGHEDLVTFDMGGTSTDVCLVEGGVPAAAPESEIDGLPFRTEALAVHTVGAGGGSIIWIDAGGALSVGPHSAGADPGPACYGRGGAEPTVTDAHLLLGHLDPETPLASDLRLDLSAAESALEQVARSLGTSSEEVAAAALKVVRAQMARAIRVVSVERGRDPRTLTLVAFGGAGPMHACALADEMEMTSVMVPPAAGVLSALGLLTAPLTADESLTRITKEAIPEELEVIFKDLEAQAAASLSSQGIGAHSRQRLIDCRYQGQAHEVTIEADPLEKLEGRFHDAHGARFGWNAPEEPLELVTFRVRARGPLPEVGLPEVPRGRGAEPTGAGWAYLGSTQRQVSVYVRDALGAGDVILGPAVVRSGESTIVLEDSWSAEVHPTGSLLLRRT